MNFLTHALPYLEEPLIVVGTAVPDWLSVLDRKIRARGHAARPLLAAADPTLRLIASGVIRHHADDRWFHSTLAFAETSLQLAVELRDQLPGDAGFRPSFVGHILVEICLDAFWLRDDRQLGERYYHAVSSVSGDVLERGVAAITGQPVAGLASLVDRFVAARFLYDYLDHDKLLWRLNQVMHRAGLVQLPDSLLDWFPDAERTIEARRVELLTPPNAPLPYPLISSR